MRWYIILTPLSFLKNINFLGKVGIEFQTGNFHLGSNANHPKKGSSTKVAPIRDLDDIARIKKLLSDKKRDLCLWTLGINSAFRCGEILSITVGQVEHLKAGDRFELKESKTGKHRAVTINQTVADAIQNWLTVHPNPKPDAPLFVSKKSKRALTVSAVNRMLAQVML